MTARKVITMHELGERNAVLGEAMTWRGTPFMWEQCVKGAGVDCGRFLAGALNGAGVRQIDLAKVPHWSAQWFLHKSEDQPSPFIEQIKLFGGVEYQLEPGRIPLPADIVIAKCGRDWTHSALVVEWPKVIFCASGHCVAVSENIHRSPQFGLRPLRYFDPWGGAR